jgi:outer membrane lipoprotein LolB
LRAGSPVARASRRMQRLFVAACALVCVACATLPPPSVEAPPPEANASFAIGGRISARRGDSGVAGNFSWTHDATRDAIELSTPLGQTLARLEGDAQEVTVHLSDGRVERAPTWNALTEHAFGVTIPVDGLAAWVRGVPREGSRASIERDGAGRVSLLRQDGWEVAYTYADDRARSPFRVTLQYPGAEPVEVRVVVDRWGA